MAQDKTAVPSFVASNSAQKKRLDLGSTWTDSIFSTLTYYNVFINISW